MEGNRKSHRDPSPLPKSLPQSLMSFRGLSASNSRSRTDMSDTHIQGSQDAYLKNFNMGRGRTMTWR